MAVKNPVVRGVLPITRRHLSFAKGNKAVGFLLMPPDQFLRLTTSKPENVLEIEKQSRPYRDYLKWAMQDVQPPLLKIERLTGQVTGHEGRHRAAASLKVSPKAKLWVAIILTDADGRGEYKTEEYRQDGPPWMISHYLGRKNIPTRLTGEFAPVFETIKTTPFIALWGRKRREQT